MGASAWAVVGGGIVVWFGDALAVLEGPAGGGRTGAPVRAAGTTRSPTSRRERLHPVPPAASAALLSRPRVRRRGRPGSRSPRRRPRGVEHPGRRRAALGLGAGHDLRGAAQPRPRRPMRVTSTVASRTSPARTGPRKRTSSSRPAAPRRRRSGWPPRWRRPRTGRGVGAVHQGAAVVGVRVGHVAAVGDGEDRRGRTRSCGLPSGIECVDEIAGDLAGRRPPAEDLVDAEVGGHRGVEARAADDEQRADSPSPRGRRRRARGCCAGGRPSG